jgi:hypothetical protein
MQLKNIGILVLAAAVLVVMTGGMASAVQYKWINTDHSKLSSAGHAPWQSYVNNEASAVPDEKLYWKNKCENDWSGKNVYPRIGGGDFPVLAEYSIGYHGTWNTDGIVTAVYGWHAPNIGHWYGNSYGGQDYASSGPQLISQPYSAY